MPAEIPSAQPYAKVNNGIELVIMRLLLICLAIAAFIFLISGGHLLFLPLLLFIPVGLLGHHRYRRYSGRR